MSTNHPVPAEWATRAYVDANGYAEKYRQSLEQPEAFWRAEIGPAGLDQAVDPPFEVLIQ